MGDRPQRQSNEAQQRNRPSQSAIIKIFYALEGYFHKRQRKAEEREAQRDRNETRLANWTRIVGIFTIILSAVALGTGYILWRTDQTSRDTNRAFVYFDDATLISYPQEKPVEYAILARVTNSGNTPARTVKLAFSCPPRDSSKRAIDNYDLEPLKPQYDQPTFIGPKQGFDLIACELPLTLISDIKSGIEQFVVAEAKYADVFELEKMRVSQMTRIIRVDDYGRHRLGYAGQHNCSDSDCAR